MFFTARRRNDRDAAQRIYAAIVAQARQPAFFRDLGVPDSLDGRFEMLALHIFAVTDRLVDGGEGDADLARLVAEAFFSDMDASLREMGVGDLTVPKRIKTLYRAFGGRLQAYGTAVRGSDDALAAAIERNIFPDGDPGHASVHLASYLVACLHRLRSTSLSEIRGGSLPFPAPDSRPAEEGRTS